MQIWAVFDFYGPLIITHKEVTEIKVDDRINERESWNGIRIIGEGIGKEQVEEKEEKKKKKKKKTK